MNKVLNILTIFIQVGITLISLIILYMILTITDYRGGFDGFIGIVIFQPIMAILFSILTILVCGLVGLPIRINRKLNKWWRTNFYVSIILASIGFIFCILSFLPTLVQQVEYENEGIKELLTIPNPYLLIFGWFLIGFGILHSFPPYKLQLKLTDWLNQKFPKDQS